MASYTLDGFNTCIPESILTIKLNTIDGKMSLRETLESVLHESEIIYDANWTLKNEDDGAISLESFHALSNLSYISLVNTPYGKLIVKNARRTR